jgi:DNA polymerase-4/DNA polymerase V
MTNDNVLLSLQSFPKAIVHIDADAFFASCEQSRDPKLKGKPVITGKERGIVSSMSYEAKRMGVTRAMRLSDVRKLCPDAVFLPSDYETYSILSKRLFAIVRRYTPDVEEYSIDECFADLTGLRRPLRMSYEEIAIKIKHDLDTELGFTFSVGLAPTKILAKLASKWMKPSGFTSIPGSLAQHFLAKTPVEKVWGIGPNTSAYLAKYGIVTALDFAAKDLEWIRSHLTKPHFEIWQELRGISVYQVHTEEKTDYASMQKAKTFTPASNDETFVFSQLSKNIENVCIKMRRYNLASTEAVFFLKTQEFRYNGMEITFSHATAYPHEVIRAIKEPFKEIFNPKSMYRATGIVMMKLKENIIRQPDLFGETLAIMNAKKLYEAVDQINEKFGKHKIYLASSFAANHFSQHLGERGDVPERKGILFRGETKRKRLAIPMFLGEVG